MWRSVVDALELQAERVPDQVAVESEEGSLGFRGLHRRANQLAHFLKRLGVGPEVPVGVAIQPSPALVVSWLAIWKADGVYVPLDLDHPPERLARMMEDARVRVVVCERGSAQRLPAQRAELVCLEDVETSISKEPCHRPPRQNRPEQLAYLIFTSGSSGRPKGVECEHRGLPNLLRSHIDLLAVRASDRILQFASPAFDASI